MDTGRVFGRTAGRGAATRGLVAAAVLFAAGHAAAQSGPTPDAGRLLYDNHCVECHESGVHIRARRKARSLADIDGWVRRWAAYLELDWTEEQFGLVRDWINVTYYGY